MGVCEPTTVQLKVWATTGDQKHRGLDSGEYPHALQVVSKPREAEALELPSANLMAIISGQRLDQPVFMAESIPVKIDSIGK